MSGCEGLCVLIIWVGFLFPVLVSSCCLIFRKQKIFYKLKYFSISVLVGYAWVSLFTVVRNLMLGNGAVKEGWYSLLMEYPNTFITIDLAMHMVPILILSYLLSENKIINFGKLK